MKAKQLVFSFAALLFFAGLAGCNSDGDSEGSGKLTVKMTDAPFPTELVAEANVTISKIEVRQSGSAEGSPFVTVMETEVSANLLDLTNGVVENLADLEIPAGSYDLVRVYVSDASIVLSDGTTFNVTVPSGTQSGVKIFIDPAIEVAGGLTAELLLDFNVGSSFVAQGNLASPAGITGFHFKPVIKASNESFAGRLTGKVTAGMEGEATAVSGAQVSVYAADTLNTMTFTAEDGSYTLLGLHAGMYDVVVEAEGYVETTSDDVEIVAANATTLNLTLEQE